MADPAQGSAARVGPLATGANAATAPKSPYHIAAIEAGYWPTDESRWITEHWRAGRVHILKTVQPYFRDVKWGRKTFEVRFNDRGFQPDDMLILAEWDGEDFTGQDIVRRVTYVMRDGWQFGVKSGYVVLGLVNPNG